MHLRVLKGSLEELSSGCPQWKTAQRHASSFTAFPTFLVSSSPHPHSGFWAHFPNKLPVLKLCSGEASKTDTKALCCICRLPPFCFHLIPSFSFTSFPLVYIHVYLDRTEMFSFPGCIPIYIFLKPSYRYLSLIRALHFHPLSIWQKLSASFSVFTSPGPGLSIVFCTFFSCYVGSPQDC